jgi:hypothetical protein
MSEVMTRRFRSLRVLRERADPIQLDGELFEAGMEIEVSVRGSALEVLVPSR